MDSIKWHRETHLGHEIHMSPPFMDSSHTIGTERWSSWILGNSAGDKTLRGHATEVVSSGKFILVNKKKKKIQSK